MTRIEVGPLASTFKSVGGPLGSKIETTLSILNYIIYHELKFLNILFVTLTPCLETLGRILYMENP